MLDGSLSEPVMIGPCVGHGPTAHRLALGPSEFDNSEVVLPPAEDPQQFHTALIDELRSRALVEMIRAVIGMSAFAGSAK